MVKKEVLSEVKIANKKDYFEITKDKHVHFVCKKCGHIEDFLLDTDNIIKTVQKFTEDKIIDTNLIFDVICKECLSRK